MSKKNKPLAVKLNDGSIERSWGKDAFRVTKAPDGSHKETILHHGGARVLSETIITKDGQVERFVEGVGETKSNVRVVGPKPRAVSWETTLRL